MNPTPPNQTAVWIGRHAGRSWRETMVVSGGLMVSSVFDQRALEARPRVKVGGNRAKLKLPIAFHDPGE
jgi:hypothetical protein